jgi:hypothetical protein
MINHSFQIPERVHKARKKLLTENGVGKITIGRYPNLDGRLPFIRQLLGLSIHFQQLAVTPHLVGTANTLYIATKQDHKPSQVFCIPEHHCAIL